MSAGATLLLLVIGGIIQYFLSVASQRERNKRISYEVVSLCGCGHSTLRWLHCVR